MVLMERKELFREYKGHKLYFGMYLDDGIVYGGYSINNNELGIYHSISSLFNKWNSFTGDNLDSSNPIDLSFCDDIIIEYLNSNHKINAFEGYSWEEIGLLCLEKLDEVDVLGDVGRKLLEHNELFPITLYNLSEWLEGQASCYETMATSSLVGENDELAIYDWVAKEEWEVMRDLLYGEKNSYIVVITNSFIRDIQVAPDEYIEAVSNDEDVSSVDYNWSDSDDGELAIGVYKGYSLKEALEEASIVWNIDKRALKGYELK